jgi:hypothetical protein
MCLSLPFNPSRCLEDLRPFVKRTGPWLPKDTLWTHGFGVKSQTQRRRKSKANRTDRPTGDFRGAGILQGGAYAAWRVYR